MSLWQCQTPSAKCYDATEIAVLNFMYSASLLLPGKQQKDLYFRLYPYRPAPGDTPTFSAAQMDRASSHRDLEWRRQK